MAWPVVIPSAGRQPYITVCGPLAAGKTTIAKLLAARFGWSVLLEDLDQNPYMHDYYLDMPRWGFHAVIAFLARAQTLQGELSRRLADEAICQDWHFSEHYAIYGVHVFEEGIIDERERATCEELHRYLMSHAVVPDLAVVLTAEPAILLARARSRQRPGEQAIPVSYIEHLVARYSQWVATLNTPYLVVDTTVQDIVNDTTAADRLISQVQQRLL